MLLGLGARDREHGVVVVGDGSGDGPFDLLACDTTRVTPTLLSLVGTIERGVGQPVNIPAELLDQAVAELGSATLWTLAERLEELGVTRIEASSLARMCQRIWAGGQLGVTSRSHGTPDRRAPWVIGFHANDTGWFSQVRPAAPGGATVTVAPTDTSRLLRQWAELACQLTPASR